MPDSDLRRVESMAQRCLQVIDKYSWLLDAFVLDFFTEQHWKQMPKCWQGFLSSIQPEELGTWMSTSNETKCAKLWPLSLLALRSVVQCHMLPRQPNKSNGYIHINSTFEWLDVDLGAVDLESSSTSVHYEGSDVPLSISQLQNSGHFEKRLRVFSPGEPTQCVINPSLKNLFVKHVKPKKRHEIVAMAKICSRTAQYLNCTYVVDVGAGKGHLSRLLSYGYGLRVCCLEAQSNLSETARKLDEELEYTAKKHIGAETVAALPRPIHINIMLNAQKKATDFVSELREALNVPADHPFTFGIVGLHPCGDLAPALLQLFSACQEAKFISIVGCCYMKITLKPDDIDIQSAAYPLSTYFRSLPSQVASQSYEALEIACHAFEQYTQRLQQGQYSDLKIHNFRAVLEQIIVGIYPEKRRLGLRSVKHAHKMDFTQYAKVAISRAGIKISDEALRNADIQESLKSWKQVVVFYTLRLLVAPLVETAVLLDRLLFLGQRGYECCIFPGFDPLLSPRNHILLGCKS